jgi:spermidine synthase
LTSVPTNHAAFMILVSLLLTLLSLPFLIPMGRLLPIGYSLISKNRDNYGDICGRIYFVNALGTLVGSLLLGHYILHWLDVEHVFKILILVFAALTMWLLILEKQQKQLLLAGVAVLMLLVLPQWDRYNHQVGLFREQGPAHYSFKGLFHIAASEKKDKVLFFDDGPNTTVTVLEMPPMGEDVAAGTVSRSLFVNGKSDGSTYGDHSTVTMLATIPYCYAKPEKDLNAAVIGLGTGVTAGILGTAADVKKVTVLEISSTVLDTMGMFDSFTENLSKNKKVEFVESDAFRFFAKTNEKFDMIVSEPSNPWVTGVENLFTPAFYSKAKSALAEGGVFMQWAHVYGMNDAVLSTIIKNVSSSFPYTKFYVIGVGDVGILASSSPLTKTHLEKRWKEAPISKRQTLAGLWEPQNLDLLKTFSEKELFFIGAVGGGPVHDIDTPSLSAAAHKSIFLNPTLDLGALLPPEFSRLFRDSGGDEFLNAVKYFAAKYNDPQKIPHCQEPVDLRRGYMCDRLKGVLTKYLTWQKMDKNRLNYDVLSLYRELRQRGGLRVDVQFLNQQASSIPLKTPVDTKAALLLVQEFSKEALWDDAKNVVHRLMENTTLTTEAGSQLAAQVEQTKFNITQVVNGFLKAEPSTSNTSKMPAL